MVSLWIFRDFGGEIDRLVPRFLGLGIFYRASEKLKTGLPIQPHEKRRNVLGSVSGTLKWIVLAETPKCSKFATIRNLF